MSVVLLWYLLIINCVAFFVMGMDKLCAARKKPRVPEKTLFTLAYWGGSFGVLLAMLLIRHKTQKNRFRFGIPALLLGQAAVVYAILRWVFPV